MCFVKWKTPLGSTTFRWMLNDSMPSKSTAGDSVPVRVRPPAPKAGTSLWGVPAFLSWTDEKIPARRRVFRGQPSAGRLLGRDVRPPAPKSAVSLWDIADFCSVAQVRTGGEIREAPRGQAQCKPNYASERSELQSGHQKRACCSTPFLCIIPYLRIPAHTAGKTVFHPFCGNPAEAA